MLRFLWFVTLAGLAILTSFPLPAADAPAGRRVVPPQRRLSLDTPLVLPARFWEMAPADAALALCVANTPALPGGTAPFQPVAGAPPVPASGSASLAFGYSESRDRAQGELDDIYRFIFVRWSPGQAEFFLYAHLRSETAGRQTMPPARCHHLLAVTQCLLAGEAGAISEEQSMRVIVNRGPLQLDLRASDARGAWRLQSRTSFFRGDLQEWGAANSRSDTAALRGTLAAALWWQEFKPPRREESPRPSQNEELERLRDLLGQAEPFLQPPASEHSLRLAQLLSTLAARWPVAEADSCLRQMRALLGSASVQLLPQIERLRPRLELAEGRFRLARTPQEMAQFLACPKESYGNDCAWALEWLRELPADELAPILCPVFASLSPELQQRWYPALHSADPAAAAMAVSELVAQGSPVAKTIQAQALLQKTMRGDDDKPDLPALIALVRDRSLAIELRERAVSYLSPNYNWVERSDPGLNPLMVELAASEPTGSKILAKVVWSIARRRPAGGFFVVQQRWQAGDFAPGPDREAALLAMAVCAEQASEENRRWLARLIEMDIERGSSLAVLAAWMGEQWQLAPRIRDLSNRAKPSHATVLAHWWLAIAQASGTERLQRAIALFEEKGTDNLFWHPQGEGGFDFDRKAVVIGWLRRGITPLNKEERQRVRDFLRWAHDYAHGVDTDTRALILLPVDP